MGLLFVAAGTATASAQDSDGDGISDVVDRFPCDSSAVAEAFAPGQGAHGLLLFEDFWPVGLDLDYNDLALTYAYAYALTEDGRVSRLRMTYEVLALGGAIDHGFGVQLPASAASASSITLQIGTAPAVSIAPSSGDANLTVVASQNLRTDLFGGAAAVINSKNGVTPQVGQTIEIEIRFATPVALPVGEAPYDVFTMRSGDATHEIHRPEFCGTSQMNPGLFGTGIDGSDVATPRCYVDGTGLPSALHIPEIVDYPFEGNPIHNLYPTISSFAASGGQTHADFYLHPVAGQAFTPQISVQLAADRGLSVDTSCLSGIGSSPTSAGTSCQHILQVGASRGDGLYWIDPDGAGGTGAVQVVCDMTTDGGGWTVCARQTFDAPNRYLGNSQLGSTWGTVGSNQWGVDCASLMDRVAPAGKVELMLQGSTAGEWQWIWPFDTHSFDGHVNGSNNTNCDGQAETITECKGSATAGLVAVSKTQACHNSNTHRTSDHYFIWQASDGQNSNVLMEFGQGDGNHPVGIRPDCGTTGWWGGCSRVAGSYPYQSANYCGSGRDYGTVSVGFRERATYRDPIGPADGSRREQAAISCHQLLVDGLSRGTGTYWVDPNGGLVDDAVRVTCDMTTDGGGWTICAQQSFGAPNRYLGNGQLGGVWGDPTLGRFGADCASLMKNAATGGQVELILQGSTTGEWQWVYPIDADRFEALIHGSLDTQYCDTTAARVTECKGSATTDMVPVSKLASCHTGSQHKTTDHYFIYQVADGRNSNVLMEIGQGDHNHPVGIRPDCSSGGWWSGCSRPVGSFAYQSSNYCASGRDYGTAAVGFRERNVVASGPADGSAPRRAARSCDAILAGGFSNGDGLYWIDTNGGSSNDARQVPCDMTTDGGGWTVCAKQDFSGSNRYLGRTMLGSVTGSPTTNQFSLDCAQMMSDLAPGGAVEFMLEGSTAGEWQWLYPFDVDSFFGHVKGSNNSSCDTNAMRVTECRGSATSGTVGVNKIPACHTSNTHRTTDHYFIFQVSSAVNQDVLMEIGQGDVNHPVGIRPDCGTTGWWGGCARVAGSHPYQSSNYCSSGRDYGTVTVKFRPRP